MIGYTLHRGVREEGRIYWEMRRGRAGCWEDEERKGRICWEDEERRAGYIGR